MRFAYFRLQLRFATTFAILWLHLRLDFLWKEAISAFSCEKKRFLRYYCLYNCLWSYYSVAAAISIHQRGGNFAKLKKFGIWCGIELWKLLWNVEFCVEYNLVFIFRKSAIFHLYRNCPHGLYFKSNQFLVVVLNVKEEHIRIIFYSIFGNQRRVIFVVVYSLSQLRKSGCSIRSV